MGSTPIMPFEASMDIYTQGKLKYILNDIMGQVLQNFQEKGQILQNFQENPSKKMLYRDKSLVDMIFLESKDMRMYENVRELVQEVTTFLGFPGYEKCYHQLLREPPVKILLEPYKSMTGKQYLFRNEIFYHMQRMIFYYDSTYHNCRTSKFIASTMLLALRKLQARKAGKLELIECTPQQIDQFVLTEILQKVGPNECDNYILLGLFPLRCDFTLEDNKDLINLYKAEQEKKETDKNGEQSTEDLSATCVRWLDNLYEAVKNKDEWFKPNNGASIPPKVRVFNDNNHKLVIITELVEQTKNVGIDLNLKQLPETFFSSAEISTIEFKEIFGLIGKENMSKIEFVVTPIRRAKHQAVRIPTLDGRFCIPASDALIQLLRKLIHGKKIFQRSNRESWKKAENFVNKVTAFYNRQDVSYFFIDCRAVDQMIDECDYEFLKLDLPNTATYIQDVKRGELDVEKIRKELINLNLVRVFPNILDYAELAFERICTSKYENYLRTSDMYDTVEYCQMACIFKHFPKIKQFLHSQKSCYRILNSDCSECVVPRSMKHTKWKKYDEILKIQEATSDYDQEEGLEGPSLSVYPLCIIDNNYEVYPATSFLKDSYFLKLLSIAGFQKHSEVISTPSPGVFPFVLIDKTDTDWYCRFLLPELMEKKETICFRECIDRMMQRKRDKYFLRTMWRSDGDYKECVGVLKDEVFYILPFVLKQQSLFTKENAEKLRKLYLESQKPKSSTVLQVFNLRDLKELLEMFNINKEMLVLVPDYNLLRADAIYDTTHGKAYEMTYAVWFLFKSFGLMCDWSDVLKRESKDFEYLRILYTLTLESITEWFGQKNTYIALNVMRELTDQLSSECDRRGVGIFSHMRKHNMSGEFVKFIAFLDHPLVKLNTVFSSGVREKLGNTTVKKWRVVTAITLLIIENILKDDHPELKTHFISCLKKDIDFAPFAKLSLEDNIVYADAGSPEAVARRKEAFEKKRENQLEATVENVFRFVLGENEQKGEETMENPVEESICNQTPKISAEGHSEDMKTEQGNIFQTNQSSHEISNEAKKTETSKSKSPDIPIVEASTSAKRKNPSKKKRKREQILDNKNQDGAAKEEDKVQKCSKCYQASLNCTEAKEKLNSEKKKVTSMEKKLEAKEKELNVFKKREADIEAKMKKMYEDELNDVNRKLKELTNKYNEASSKINELQESLEWRKVEVDRKVDQVKMNKQRELDAKDSIANSLRETIKKLTEQSKSKDILTGALQENIKDLTQQLKSKDLILQTIPHQIPFSSNQQHDQPSTSSSTPDNATMTISQEGNPKEIIKAVLKRLEDDRKKIITECSMKQERVAKLLKNLPGRETSQWINYELRKFNVDYQPYLKALNDQISMVEKVDELPPLPPAPSFSEKFMEMYNGIVQKESELKAKNYTRNKPAVGSRPPEELDDQECVICLVEMEDRNKTIKCSMCSRRYHDECVDDWLRLKRLCPICNESMLRVQEFPIPE